MINVEDLRAWLAGARDGKATTLVIVRASKWNREGDPIGRFPIAKLEPEPVIETLRRDLDSRRKRMGNFHLRAVGAGDKVIASRTWEVLVTGATDDDEAPETMAQVVKIVCDQNERFLRAMLDDRAQARAEREKQNELWIAMVDKLGARVTENDKAHGELFKGMVEMSRMQLERERQALEARERAEMIKGAISEAGPIAQLIAGKVLGIGPTARLEALVKSIRKEQWEKLGQTQSLEFDAAQMQTLGDIISEMMKAEAKAEEKKQASAHANGAPGGYPAGGAS